MVESGLDRKYISRTALVSNQMYYCERLVYGRKRQKRVGKR